MAPPSYAALLSAVSWALVLIVAGGCLVSGVLRHTGPPEPVPDTVLLDVFPGAARMEGKNDPFPYYRAFDAGGRPLGAVIITDSVPPAVKGYLGEIGVAAGVTRDGQITRVLPVRHRETPYYMEMVNASSLYEELGGLDLSTPFPGIDSVSGATVSSQAVIRDVRETTSLAARSLFGIDVPPTAVPMPNPWVTWRTGLLVILLALSFIAGFSGDRTRLRSAVMLLNLAGVGFILNTPLTLSALSRVLTLDLPGPGNTLLILLFLYIAASLPLHGRSYCRLVCPFGVLQHLTAQLSPWKWTLSPGISALLPVFRRFVLGILLFLGVWVGWSGFTEVEPFFGLFSMKLTTLLWAVVIFLLVASVFIRRFWCNAICPTGTLLAMASRAVRPQKGRLDETV